MAFFWQTLATRGAFAVRFDDIGGVRTRYVEAGESGEAVVLLHGTGGHLETYVANVIPHAERFRVFAPDMLGHGFSDKPPHDYEIRHYVKHLLEFLDAKKIEHAHISGESLGGWIAARFAIEHPKRLVLNTPALRSGRSTSSSCQGKSTSRDMNPSESAYR